MIVEADAKGASEVRIALPELSNKDATIKYAPPASDPSQAASRPIQLFSVNNMKVTEESHDDWVWAPNGSAKPKNCSEIRSARMSRIRLLLRLPHESADRGAAVGLRRATMPARQKIKTFLWYDANVERERPAAPRGLRSFLGAARSLLG